MKPPPFFFFSIFLKAKINGFCISYITKNIIYYQCKILIQVNFKYNNILIFNTYFFYYTLNKMSTTFFFESKTFTRNISNNFHKI